MTSTKVTTRARAREDAADTVHSREKLWFIPPGRDPQDSGPCLFPRCEAVCDRHVPACGQHWKNAPEPLTRAIRDGWRAKDRRRWLMACEALRLYWHAVSP